MSGTIRPSSSMCAFQSVNDALELRRIVAAALEPNRIVRLRRDAVLVPGDVPRDGHDDLGVDARERRRPRPRRPERLADPADRPPVLRGVEEVGRLDHRLLVIREAAQDRLGRRSSPRRRAAACRAGCENQPPCAACARRNGRVSSARPRASSRTRPRSRRRAGRRRRSRRRRSARSESPSRPSAACARRSRTNGRR